MMLSALLTLAIAAPWLPRTHAIDNGIGRTPPMGWRSWNAFGGRISQAIMTEQAIAMAATTGTADGRSLLSYGYQHVGLDDNWQQCGKGPSKCVAERQILQRTKALRCTATAWILIVTQCSAIPTTGRALSRAQQTHPWRSP